MLGANLLVAAVSYNASLLRVQLCQLSVSLGLETCLSTATVALAAELVLPVVYGGQSALAVQHDNQILLLSLSLRNLSQIAVGDGQQIQSLTAGADADALVVLTREQNVLVYELSGLANGTQLPAVLPNSAIALWTNNPDFQIAQVVSTQHGLFVLVDSALLELVWSGRDFQLRNSLAADGVANVFASLNRLVLLCANGSLQNLDPNTGRTAAIELYGFAPLEEVAQAVYSANNGMLYVLAATSAAPQSVSLLVLRPDQSGPDLLYSVLELELAPEQLANPRAQAASTNLALPNGYELLTIDTGSATLQLFIPIQAQLQFTYSQSAPWLYEELNLSVIITPNLPGGQSLQKQ